MDQVIEVRQRFLEDFHANRDLYDERDLLKINSDLWVKRFINFLDQGADKGLEHMKETFRWRKSFGVNDFDRTTIPLEVYQMGPLFIYEPDAKGSKVVLMAVKLIAPLD